VHTPPLQAALPFAGEAGHGLHEGPQASTDVVKTQLPEQRCVDGLHAVATQAVPAQASAVAPSVGQGAQSLPHSL
jgi:hypothetical protein